MENKIKTNQLECNAIHMEFEINMEGKMPIGTSKFGGEPDLPANFEWPHYRSPYEESTLPLSFLMQINCSEIAKYDKDSVLPHSGMLYFFYELSEMPWGDEEEKDGARVYYFDTNRIIRLTLPFELEEYGRLPEIPICFEATQEVPSKTEHLKKEVLDVSDEFFEDDYLDENISKLLGYANMIQGDIREDCELASQEIGYDEYRELPNEKRKEIEDRILEWKLLMQLDTVSKGDFELMFCDGGRLYFYIKEADLAKKQFDNCWFRLQSY